MVNLQHLQYFVALAEHGQYRAAAQHCHISQPALSMAIKSLEDELDVPLINRLTKPLQLTAQGELYYQQAKKVLYEYHTMLQLQPHDQARVISLRLGVIPTVAPYLVPRFLGQFMEEHPKLELKVEEIQTEIILDKISKNELDLGILVTPLEAKSLQFEVLYYEEFFVYTEQAISKDYVMTSDIDPNGLWLLEEGHCMRDQMLQLCALREQKSHQVNYRAGSIETLVNLVDQYDGITILPELSTLSFKGSRRKRLKLFYPPAPVREVSLVYHKYSVQKVLTEDLRNTVRRSVPKYMLARDGQNRVDL